MSLSAHSMKPSIAIFYDIENLIGGYGASIGGIKTVSLRKIRNRIQEIEGIQEKPIVVQRAYADWSNPRLGVLRHEIIDLGIEPIQLFGFGKGTSIKNASDIQIVIDAMDLAYLRSFVETFVVVSGDGGFAALAKKLHELGKEVVGCAYRRSSNQVFERVCDHFVCLEEPEEKAQNPAKKAIQTTDRSGSPTPGVVSHFKNSKHNQRLQSFQKKFSTIEIHSVHELVERAREALEAFVEGDSEFLMKGLELVPIPAILRWRIKDFSPQRYGFPKMLSLLRCAIHDSKLSLFQNAENSSSYLLAGSDAVIEGYEKVVTDCELPILPSEKAYRTLLAKCVPFLVVDHPEMLIWLASCLEEQKDRCDGQKLEEWITSISDLGFYEPSLIKQGLLTFRSAGAFVNPADSKASVEQPLGLRLRTKDELLDVLKQQARAKLDTILGEVDSQVFDGLWRI